MKIKRNMNKKIGKFNTKKCFYKTNFSGISLIVLVITIIVIIILATAIILTLINNNPINEANKARFESDRESIQAIFTNTVAKVMAKNQSSINIKAGQINDVVMGVNETIGEVMYELENPEEDKNKNGKIIFDNKENTEVEYYIGRKIPIYKSGKTIWSVDNQGNINLSVGDKIVNDTEDDYKDEIKISKEEYENLINRIDNLEKNVVNIKRVNLLEKNVDTLVTNVNKNCNTDISLNDSIEKYKYLEINYELVSTDYVQHKFQETKIVSVDKIKYNNNNTQNLNDSSVISINVNSINNHRILVWFKDNIILHIGSSASTNSTNYYLRIKSIYGIN